MLSLSQIEKIAKKNHATVGIGDDGGSEIVYKSAESAQKEGFAEVEVFKSAESLIEALKNGSIDAAVRGTLGAKDVLGQIKSDFSVKKVMRIAFLLFEGRRVVLLAPVGVDEGGSIEEKVEILNYACELLSKFGTDPKVGVLSGGRLEDFKRSPRVDNTLIQGEKLTSKAQDMGLQARHFGILLEEAVKGSNLVIPLDGITGNLIFRSLHFFGGAKGMGAPVVNIPRTFIDTSRDKDDYSSAIALASALFS